MLDINFIRENPEKTKKGVEKKQINPKLVDRVLDFDKAWREKTVTLDSLRSKQNKISKNIHLSDGKKNEDILSQAQVLKKQISKIEKEENELKDKRDKFLEDLPNIPFEDVPVGKDDSENVVAREVGEKPNFDFQPKSYIELGEELNIINTQKAAEVSGGRFGYLLGDAAMLEFALVRLAFDTLLEKGFTPIIPPVMVRPEIMVKMGKGKFIDEKDAFYVKDNDLYLVGSSEHSIGPFRMNEKINEDEFPLKYAGFSTCFRREAGSYGKDTRGILRVHQFDKIEMLVFSLPENSEKMHKEMVSIQESLMQKLELPYRVMEICTGDMTWADARQFDVETWFPFEGKYRETHSCSNTTDFQARGVNTKYKSKKDNKTHLVHMLNGTAFAIGRTVIAIIENNQTKEGTVKVPKVLQDYVGKEEIK
jgi:seryl-tRNA synthetase